MIGDDYMVILVVPVLADDCVDGIVEYNMRIGYQGTELYRKGRYPDTMSHLKHFHTWYPHANQAPQINILKESSDASNCVVPNGKYCP